MTLAEITERYSLAARELLDASHEALSTAVTQRFPTATSYTTWGEYNSDNEVKVIVSHVYNAAGEDLMLAAFTHDSDAEVEFDNEIEEHLNWLGALAPDDYLLDQVHDLPRYRYWKLCAVLRLREDYDPNEDIQQVIPPDTPYGEVMFAATDPGYDGEFDQLGADPTSWIEEGS